MTTPIDLNQVRRAWTQRYGATQARHMMAGARGAAFDSALSRSLGGRARDQEEPGDDPMNAIKIFIKNRLSPEDWSRLNQMLQALSDGGGEQEGEGERSDYSDGGLSQRPREGEDRGRRFAHDAAPRGYFDMFPANSAVEVW